MKTGINLLLWTTFIEAEHHGLLGELKGLGYDGVELPIGRGDAAHYRDLGRVLDRIGLERTAVTSVDAATNPASPDPQVRRRAGERLAWAIDMAAELGAEVLCGPYHSAYKEFTGPRRRRTRHGGAPRSCGPRPNTPRRPGCAWPWKP